MNERLKPFESELLAQVVTCNFYPDGSVVEYIGSGPYARCPEERRHIQWRFAAPFFCWYQKNRGGTLIAQTRSFNFGVLATDEDDSHILMIRKTNRPGWDVPAGASRRKLPIPWHAAAREALAEEMVAVSNGRLLLPEREKDYTFSQLRTNFHTWVSTLNGSSGNLKTQMLGEALAKKPIFIPQEIPDWLRPLLKSFTVVYPDRSPLSETAVLNIIHKEGGDVLFPFRLGKTMDFIDLECVTDENGRLQPLQRQHAWFPVNGLPDFLGNQPIAALVYTQDGLKEQLIDPLQTPLFPLAQEVAKTISPLYESSHTP